MVFSHPQHLHPLLPQNQNLQATEKFAAEISQTRQGYFGLLQKRD